MTDLTRRRILSSGALSLLTLDTALAQQPLNPTPECRDSDTPTMRQTEGPFFTPMSPERTELIDPGMAGQTDRACRVRADAVM